MILNLCKNLLANGVPENHVNNNNNHFVILNFSTYLHFILSFSHFTILYFFLLYFLSHTHFHWLSVGFGCACVCLVLVSFERLSSSGRPWSDQSKL